MSGAPPSGDGRRGARASLDRVDTSRPGAAAARSGPGSPQDAPRAGWGHGGALALVAGLVGLVLAACGPDARDKTTAFLFPGLAKPEERPPTQKVRRDLSQEVEQLQRQVEVARAETRQARQDATATLSSIPAENAKTWAEVERLLPKDPSGGVDWEQALETGVIAPRPGPGPRARLQALLDLDVAVTGIASPAFRTTFAHRPHTEWLGCSSCHPSLYPLGRQGAPTRTTFARILAGELCGVCHGSVAFGIQTGCGRCHPTIPVRSTWKAPAPAKPVEGARTWDAAARLLPQTDDQPDWTKALAEGVIAPRPGPEPKAEEADVLDLDVTRGEGDAKAVFPHAAHTAWLRCESCHPTPFKEEGGATPMSMDQMNEGKVCGICHGKVGFPLDACGRCHPAMAG